MKLSKCFQMSISNILASRNRSLLTMLGIIIGVMSVITLVSLMNGITGEVTGMFDEIGTTTISVSIRDRGSSRKVTANDIYEIRRENPEIIAGISPSVTVNATVRTRFDSDSLETSVSGVSEQYAQMTKTTVAEGRFFDYVDVERLQNVCVIGTYIQEYLFGKTSALGETVKINGIPYTVIGVLEEKDNSSENSADECMYIPYTNASRLLGDSAIRSFNVYAESESAVDAAMETIKAKLNTILENSDFYSVTSMKQLRDMVNDITDMLTWALVFIAGISLLVGGIGIMNIMLVTVSERTKEIGIRKALGTRQRDILNLFVIEAATLSCLGGIIGIILGILLSNLVGNLMNISAFPSFGAIALSFGISTLIGVSFGYLPAKKAAKLNPIDALRFE